MRDFVVLTIILGSVPLCFIRPYFGLLMWTWIAYFNPHRLTYGIAYNFPVATVVGVPTLAGLMLTKERNRNILTRETILMFALGVWFVVNFWFTSHQPLFAGHADDGKLILVRTLKILLMTVVAVLLINNKEKLRTICMVIVFSIGFYAVKGAAFGFRTSAESRVWGPPGTFIEDNNFLAAATNMTLPLLFFLARSEKNKKVRLLLWFVFFCSIVSVLLSYSRGGLLGLATVLFVLTMKSRHKILAAGLVTVAAVMVFSYAPGKWMARMDNFLHGNLDTSAEGRLNAWHFAIVLTQHYPITGGGFETFTPELFDRFTPDRTFAGPHSIYFEMLGEQGYVGLLLFLALLASCHYTYWQVRHRAKRIPQLSWMVPYTYMFQISLLAFMVSGAFLAMAYFDYFWQIVAMTAVLRILYRDEAALARVSAERAPMFTQVAEEVAT
ncbi:MAG: putative O-glycosylation ligase, exosortase A system-associated [Candidatus Acidiferrales bacterium]